MTDGGDIWSEIALRWTSLDLGDDESTLVQVMAWCLQATSHYLNQCWPRFLLSYGISRPQWVNPCHPEFIYGNIKWIYPLFLYFWGHRDGTGSWNLCLWNIRTCWSCTVNSMAIDDQVTQGTRASTAWCTDFVFPEYFKFSIKMVKLHWQFERVEYSCYFSNVNYRFSCFKDDNDNDVKKLFKMS